MAEPPTPDGVPVLGNGLAFSRDPFDALERWATLGDVVRIRLPGQSMYLVSDPELVEAVLVERQDSFTTSQEQRDVFRDVEDNAVTGTEGDRWERLRRVLQPAFTAERIASYGPRMARRTATHVDAWTEGAVLDLHREMRLLTVRILGDTLLGVDMEGDESVLMDAADALIDRSDPRRFGQLLPDWIPTPTERQFRRRIATLDTYVEDVLDGSGSEEATARSVLVEAHDRGEISRAELEDNLVAVMLAGHDSSAVTLTYAWYELARHPEIKRRLFDEVNEVLDGRLPDGDDFDALEWTRAIINETLRLYPPAWTTPREATESVSLGGYEIPAGSQVMNPQWVLHRDDRFWDSPEQFDPGRWRHESSRPEYAYFPFSGGPRHCIGMRFARLELTVALATMAQRTDLDVTVEEPLPLQPTLTLRPATAIEATVTG